MKANSFSFPLQVSVYTPLICSLLFSTSLLVDIKPVKAQSSGCGSGWSWYLTPNLWFKEACNNHDKCYDTFGKSKNDCDKQFHNEMLAACSREFPSVFQKISGQRATCNGLADTYYTAVLEKGWESYRKAQANAKQSTQAPSVIVSSGGLCLDAKDYGQSRLGNPLQLWTCNGDPAQTWKFKPSGQIVSSGGLCLDAKDYGQSRLGNPLQLWTCNGDPAQTWLRR